MAGRHYLPPDRYRDRERAPSPHFSSADDPRRALRHDEDHIAANQREIQAILQDNQRLAATHVALKQELSAAHLDIRHLSSTAAELKAQKDAQVRDVYERSLKMEVEIRATDTMHIELEQVKTDVQKLTELKLELATKVNAVEADLVRARTELQQLPAVETEIEAMRYEIKRGRAAIEYEKKVHTSNVEQSRAMEKNMASLAQEIEKLRAELANAEKRARAAAAAAVAANPNPGYAAGYGNPAFVYGTNSYPDPYPMHQVQGSVDMGIQYGYVTLPPPPSHQSHVPQ